MSIATMKRKSRRFQAPISGQGRNFSLNGGYRNQGWVGQGSRGRTLVGTVFRGATPMGSGGCCGTYSQNIVYSGGRCTNDPSIVKRSNMNTPGLINATVDHPTAVFNANCNSSCAREWVQDFSPLNHSQGSRINKVARQSARCIVEKSDAGLDNCHKDCTSASYHIGGKKIVRTMYSKNLNTRPVSSSQYQRSGLMAKENLPTPPSKQPFPMTLSHNRGTSQVNYLTAEDAKAAGALPSNWMNGETTCDKAGRAFQLPIEGQSQRIPTQTSIPNYTDEQVAQLFGQYIKKNP